MALILSGDTGPSTVQKPAMYAGAVLQVVQTFYKTTETISTSTFTATGVSATITPLSTTSKILVFASVVTSSEIDTYGGFRLYRNASNITDSMSNQATGANTNFFLAYSSRDGDAGYETKTLTQNYLDSPASTSAQTYTLYWARMYGGVMKLNGPYIVDTGNSYSNFSPSSITLMEIAA